MAKYDQGYERRPRVGDLMNVKGYDGKTRTLRGCECSESGCDWIFWADVTWAVDSLDRFGGTMCEECRVAHCESRESRRYE